MSGGPRIHGLYQMQMGKHMPAPEKRCVGCENKLHLMVRHKFWRSGECEVFLSPLWPRFVVPVKVTSISQIDQFKVICIR